MFIRLKIVCVQSRTRRGNMIFLLTNDDGIGASGLEKLAQIAVQIADEVYIVAPDGQRSAISHAITIRQPLKIKHVEYPVEGVKAYSCSGTPADCVKVAINAVLDKKPDVVFSGINKGYNMGFDTVYSGTVAAARDAVYQGIKAVAVSTWEEKFDIVDKELKKIIEQILDKEISKDEFWNINFPDCSLDEYKGIKETKPFRYSYYLDTFKEKQLSDNEWEYTLGDEKYEITDTECDFYAIEQGYASIEKLKVLV